MASTIQLKRGSGAPSSGTLAAGEPALDLTNNKLYTSTDGTDVVEIGFSGEFEDGSAAAPSITFASDTDTGFFKSSANIIGFTSGGVSRGFEFGPSYFYLTKGISGAGVEYLRSDMLLPRLQMNIQLSTNYDFLSFSANGSGVGSIRVTPSSTSYLTSSDYRLKENITPIENAVARIDNLNPVRFNFIAQPDIIVDGFLAHEVTPVVPEAIAGEKDAVDSEGNPVYQGIDQAKLVPLLVAAVQELSARVAALEAN